MLRKHKNELLDIVKNCGINPILLSAGDEKTKGVKAFVVRVNDSALKFSVCCAPESFEKYKIAFITFTPGYISTKVGRQVPASLSKDLKRYVLNRTAPLDGYLKFKKVRAWFTYWLNGHVKHFIDDSSTPDLWSQVAKQAEMVPTTIGNGRDTQGYSEDEKRQLRLSIKDFRLLIVKEFQPSTAEMEAIDTRLGYLSEALDRLSRFDWRNVTVTTIMSISIALSLDSEKGKLLFDLFKKVFSAAYHLLT